MAAAAFFLLCVPFLPLWPEFETARRGLLLLLAGGALLLRPGSFGARLPRPLTALWVVLLLWLALGGLPAVTDPHDALFRWLYLAALGVPCVAAAGMDRERLLAATVPTTLAIAVLGIAQALGLDWPTGAAKPGQAVSTLGNLNAATEVIALGTIAAALMPGSRRSGTLAALLGAAFLAGVGSRSGWLALGCASPLLWSDPDGRRAILRALLPGVLLGALLGRAMPSADPEQPGAVAPSAASAASAEQIGTPSTIAVRLEIWKGCLDLVSEAPLRGQGPGQFRSQYPRVRREEEIELSSFGRRFRSGVATAHNDTLELAVEGGLPAALLWLGLWLGVALRALRDPERRGMVALAAAFLALGLVRAPLANAPAAALAFAALGWLGRSADTVAARAKRPPALLRSLGLALALAGLPPLLGQSFAADAVHPETPLPDRVAAAQRAVDWSGGDVRLVSLAIALERSAADPTQPARLLARLSEDLESVRQRNPHNTTALLTRAEIHAAAGAAGEATEALAELLRIDPRDPEAMLLLAVLQCRAGRAAQAAGILYARPHPVLRQGLPQHFGDLAALAGQANDRTGQRLLGREQIYSRAVLELEADPRSDAAATAVAAFARVAGTDSLRSLVLQAVAAKARGDDAAATGLARLASRRRPLQSAQEEFLEALLPILTEAEDWAAILGR